MAKTFEFGYNRELIHETEKAYGFMYSRADRNFAGRYRTAYVWLPKSQTTVEDIEFDGKDMYWHEGDVLVTVPMWLARNNSYFKYDLLKVERVY